MGGVCVFRRWGGCWFTHKASSRATQYFDHIHSLPIRPGSVRKAGQLEVAALHQHYVCVCFNACAGCSLQSHLYHYTANNINKPSDRLTSQRALEEAARVRSSGRDGKLHLRRERRKYEGDQFILAARFQTEFELVLSMHFNNFVKIFLMPAPPPPSFELLL